MALDGAQNPIATAMTPNSQAKKPKAPAVFKTDRAGTSFPVGRILQRLKQSHVAPRVRSQAAVALCAAFDEIFGALLHDLIASTLDNNKLRLDQRFLMMAIKMDTCLIQLFPNTVRDGGVVPNIFPSLLPKRVREQHRKLVRPMLVDEETSSGASSSSSSSTSSSVPSGMSMMSSSVSGFAPS
jgi:hypothetical protein